MQGNAPNLVWARKNLTPHAVEEVRQVAFIAAAQCQLLEKTDVASVAMNDQPGGGVQAEILKIPDADDGIIRGGRERGGQG